MHVGSTCLAWLTILVSVCVGCVFFGIFATLSGLPQRSGSDLLELEWKIATLPLNYRNAYGPPSIATSGRQNGSCIAVASMNGLCILDRFYKWKQFGTPSEERSFQVLAMTWWEGLSSTDARWQQGAEAEELSQDLLVAIIQSNNGRQYLSCWSPKR